jgi:hypothetical protein
VRLQGLQELEIQLLFEIFIGPDTELGTLASPNQSRSSNRGQRIVGYRFVKFYLMDLPHSGYLVGCGDRTHSSTEELLETVAA